MADAIRDVQALLEVGGIVLVAILAVALLMWTLILERFWYVLRVHPERAETVALSWDAVEDKETWDAQVVRRLWISELVMDLDQGLGTLRSLVSVCPLLGLLGTTAGMIEVYEVMAIMGQGEPRLMAEGVSQALVTTMAGLVVALSGIFFSVRLENLLAQERERLAFRMHIDEDLLGHPHRTRSEKAKRKAREVNERRRQLARERERERASGRDWVPGAVAGNAVSPRGPR